MGELRQGSGEDRVQGETNGAGAFQGRCKNVMQWKLPGIYKGDSSECS